MSKLRVFVSSVQKELENERLAVLSLISTDAFLQGHCEAVLYEFEPASPKQAAQECLALLGKCDICLTIIWKEYGHAIDGVSITRQEYHLARSESLPVLAFIKGDAVLQREPGTSDFIKEIGNDGLKYKRFGNLLELLREVRASLLQILKDRFAIEPTSDENVIAEQTITATSNFELQALKRLRWEDLDHETARRLISGAERQEARTISDDELLRNLLSRGLLWNDPDTGGHFPTAAGIVLLARDPSVVFPHCRILADAYRAIEPDGDPSDHTDLRAPMPVAIDQAIAFVERNTRHPIRILGLDRVRLDEYPSEALREALVNAVAHRNYEDGSRKIMLEVFPDRVVISSPGLPPPPITLQKLRSMKYRPCSRNPILAQCLSFFHRIEERGSGFRRMNDQMIDHGLDQPRLATDTGYFQVIFPGPGNDLKRLRVAPGRAGKTVPPSVEQQLNERQKKMAALLVAGEELTSRRCEVEFGVTRPITAKDFAALVLLGLAERVGSGRSTRYRLKSRSES
ncbi:MAG TPA: ATP-binding protein [Verrucomicrobiae bacterium]|jgi:predicted HTH transcriptional regulator